MVKGLEHKPFFKVKEGRGRCVFVFGVIETRTVLGILKFTTAYKLIYIHTLIVFNSWLKNIISI